MPSGNINLGKVIIGGVASSIILWILMQYNSKSAWLYLILILMGVMLVYRNVVFATIQNISNLLVSMTSGK